MPAVGWTIVHLKSTWKTILGWAVGIGVVVLAHSPL
jgi:hypothetical protein